MVIEYPANGMPHYPIALLTNCCPVEAKAKAHLSTLATNPSALISLLTQYGYLSRYIVRNKGAYYHNLQAVRESGIWEPWILYMLVAVEETAKETLDRVTKIRSLMLETKHQIRSRLPKIYSQDLLNNLFRHPYTKIAFIERDLSVSRITAASYLTILEEAGFLKKVKKGRTNYYINEPLFQILSS